MTGNDNAVVADQRPHKTVSRFQESLQILEQRVDWIPMGWQRLYVALRLKLRAIECPQRRAIGVNGAYEHEGYLHVEAVTDDRVIQGILRKARTAAVYTCMACGKRGSPREIGDRYLTLCATCTGFVRLHDEVLSALAQRQRGHRDVHKLVRESALLVEAFKASLGADDCTCLHDLPSEAITAWLHAMLALLDPIVDGARQ